MSPDPTPLSTAARRKSEEAQTRARNALRELDEQARPISFQAVARHAGVSRQWLYRQPQLRGEIERLRVTQPDRRTSIPTSERSTEVSLRQRLRALLDENRGLRAEIAQLKQDLALAYGLHRERPSAAGAPPANAEPSAR